MGRLFEHLRGTFRPPRTLRITSLGRTYLVLTLGVGLGALNTGNNLLYLVLGLQLSTIVMSGVLSERCLRGLQVQRLGTDAAFAEEPFAFRWKVWRDTGASYALTVSERGVTGEGRLAVLRPGTPASLRALLTCPHRGPLALSGIKVTTLFPLGLFAKSRVFEVPGELLVYPRRTARLGTLPPPPGDGRPGVVPNTRHADGEGDLHSLRPLREHEDARRVHWTKSATHGKLLRTEREREERETYLLRLPAGPLGPALDRACSETAGQVQSLLRWGHPVGLEGGGLRLRPGTGPQQETRLLRALARAGFEAPT